MCSAGFVLVPSPFLCLTSLRKTLWSSGIFWDES
jgi:hypothetical protein